MPIFKYTAIDHLGKRYQKQGTFSSKEDLSSTIRSKGHWLVECSEIERKDYHFSHSQKIPNKLLKEFFFQISILLNAGVSINEVMKSLIENASTPSFKRILEGVYAEILKGNPLSVAFEKYPNVFSPMVISLVKAGEHSATLPDTFERLNQHYEWVEKIIADIRQVIFYPAFVMIALLGLFIILFSFVIPRFELIFKEGDVELPDLTQLLFNLSHVTCKYWWLFLGTLFIAFFFVYFTYKLSARFRLLWDHLKLKIPILGPINKMLCLERFSKNLGIMYTSGVALIKSLQLSRNLIGNQILSDEVTKIINSIEKGNRFHEAMKQTTAFPSIVQQMIAVGENSGKLDISLEKLAYYYGQISSRQIKKFFSLFEPCLIITVVIVVGLIAAAVFLPVLDMASAIH